MAVKKILIVEDQALVRMYLCSCVEKSKECEVAGTLTRADAALQRCGEGHIDLILMDICTENDSDGLTAAEAIKKFYPRIKIVMVTSMLEGRFLDRARKIGADSFWYKDSPSSDLIGVIEGTLQGKQFWQTVCQRYSLEMCFLVICRIKRWKPCVCCVRARRMQRSQPVFMWQNHPCGRILTVCWRRPDIRTAIV